MGTELTSIPVEQRELLFLVRDRGEIARLLFEDFKLNGKNYKLVTIEDLCTFTCWSPESINQGDVLYWDKWKTQYQKTPSALLESEKSRGAACLNFCKDFLGAKKGLIVRNKSENSSGQLGIGGGISGGKTDKGNIKAEASFNQQKESAQKLDSRFAFGPSSAIPFSPEKAWNYYTQQHLDRFEEFQYVYEFRKNSPVVLNDDLPYSAELSLFQRGKRLINIAGEIGAELKGFGLEIHADFENNSEWDSLENLKIEVCF